MHRAFSITYDDNWKEGKGIAIFERDMITHELKPLKIVIGEEAETLLKAITDQNKIIKELAER